MEGRIWPDRKESLGCLHDHLLQKHSDVTVTGGKTPAFRLDGGVFFWRGDVGTEKKFKKLGPKTTGSLEINEI